MEEGHREASGEAMTFDMRKRDDADLRFLFIGCPAQDEPAVLRTILHFHDPLEYPDAEVSARESSQNGSQCGRDRKDAKIAVRQFSKLREHLSLRMLRRLKLEVRGDLISRTKNVKVVACAMTDMQLQLYIDILKKNRMSLTLPMEDLRSSLPNVLRELKMVCNHPFLFPGKTPKLPDAREAYEVLVASSGKLQFLEKILPPLKAHGHNVLLLSQTRMMLDIFSRFLTFLGLQHCLMNESDSDSVWQRHIDAFNSEDNGLFVALVSTKFGGQRVNLWKCANLINLIEETGSLLSCLCCSSRSFGDRSVKTIVELNNVPVMSPALCRHNDNMRIADPDYRSLVEIVARAKVHRLAQHKPMLVYCLVTKGSAEEKILRGARKKLAFEDLVMSTSTRETSADITRLLLHAARIIFEREDCDGAETSVTFSDEILKNLLDRSTSESDGERPHRHTIITSTSENTAVEKSPDSRETAQSGGIDFSTTETKENLYGVRNGCIMAPQAPQQEPDFVDPSRVTADVTLPPMCQSPMITASSGEKSDRISGAASTDLSTNAGSTGGRNLMSGTKVGKCLLSVSDFTGLDMELEPAGEAPFSPQAVVFRKSSSSLSAAKVVDKPPVIPGLCTDDNDLEKSCAVQRRENSAICPAVRIDPANASSVLPGSSVDRTASGGSRPPEQRVTSAGDGVTKARSVNMSSVILGLSDHHTDSGVSCPLKRKASSAAAARTRAKEFPNVCLTCHDSAKQSSNHLRPKKKVSRKGHSKVSSRRLPQSSRVDRRENAMDGRESAADHETVSRRENIVDGRESAADHKTVIRRENAMDDRESAADHETVNELRTNTNNAGLEGSTDESESAKVTGEQVQQVVASISLQERSSKAKVKANADILLKSSRTWKPFWLPKGDARLLMCHPKEPGRSTFH